MQQFSLGAPASRRLVSSFVVAVEEIEAASINISLNNRKRSFIN